MKENKTKDINAHKKPKSSYLVFCNIERDILRKERPDIDFKEMSKELQELENILR